MSNIPSVLKTKKRTDTLYKEVNGTLLALSVYESITDFVVSNLDEGTHEALVGPKSSKLILTNYAIGNDFCALYYKHKRKSIGQIVFYHFDTKEQMVAEVEDIEAISIGENVVGCFSSHKAFLTQDMFSGDEKSFVTEFSEPYTSSLNPDLSRFISNNEYLMVYGNSYDVLNVLTGEIILSQTKDSEIIFSGSNRNCTFVATFNQVTIIKTGQSKATALQYEETITQINLVNEEIVLAFETGKIFIINFEGEEKGTIRTRPETDFAPSKLNLVGDYLIFFWKKNLKIYFRQVTDALLKKKSYKRVESPFIHVKNHQGLEISIYHSRDSKAVVRTYSPNMKSLSAKMKKFVNSEKYEVISNSSSLSPSILKAIFQNEEFPAVLFLVASDVITKMNVVSSILNIVNGEGKLKSFLLQLLQHELEYLTEYLPVKAQRNVDANDALKSRFYPEEGFHELDVFFTENRYFTNTFSSLFNVAGERFIVNHILPVIEEILKEEKKLEVDPRLVKLGDNTLSDKQVKKTVAENSKQLTSYVHLILDALENNINHFPGVMQILLKNIHSLVTTKYLSSSINLRVQKGINKLLYWLWLGPSVINPPVKSRKTITQQRNLTLLGNMIQVMGRGEDNAISAISHWDTDDRMISISKSITQQTAKSNSWQAEELTTTKIDFVNVAEYFNFISNEILAVMSPESPLYAIWNTISKSSRSIVALENQQIRFSDEVAGELDGFGPNCYRVQSQGGVDYFQNQPIMNIVYAETVVPVTNSSLLACNPPSYPNYLDWFEDEITHHDFTIVVVYRGKVCGWCYVYMKSWNKYFFDILGRNGVLVGLSLESQKIANVVVDEWELDYPQLGDPENVLGSSYNIITGYLPGFAYGVGQPAIIVKGKGGEIIYHWSSTPSLSNNGGAVGRPRPNDVLDAIDNYFANEESSETQSISQTV